MARGYRQPRHERTSILGRKFMAGQGEKKAKKPSRKERRARKEFQESISLATNNLNSLFDTQLATVKFVEDSSKPPVDFTKSSLAWAKPAPHVGTKPPTDDPTAHYSKRPRKGLGKFVHVTRKPFRVAFSPLGQLHDWHKVSPHVKEDVLFLDEINRAPDSVQNALLNFVGKKFNLPPGVTAEEYFANSTVNMDEIKRAPKDVQEALMGEYDTQSKKKWPEDFENNIDKNSEFNDLLYRKPGFEKKETKPENIPNHDGDPGENINTNKDK